MFFTIFLSYTLLSLAAAKVQFLGMNIAGGDFGCEITGTCPTSSTQIPLSSLGGGDGQGQMKHFVQDDQMNMFRLPISWQFLANNQLGATLDSTNLGKYDQLVQACLATGAYCMIDIHNFARWNGAIIGQGGPTDDQFVSLWTQLADKYKTNSKVVFELMNEPHDLDINLWGATCQKVVTAIRQAGATDQMILLPGTNFDSAATLVSSGSAAVLLNITNPDGSTDGLLLDIHKYLDEDNSGTHSTCVTDNTDAFGTVAAYLRSVGRQGIVSETGASSDSTCLTDFCAQNAFINANSDVFIGLVAWAAGSFSTSYLLSLTPSNSGGKYVDNQLATQCVVNTWLESNDTVVTTTSAAATTIAKTTSSASTLVTSIVTVGGTTDSSSQVTELTASTMVVTMTGTATDNEPTTLMIATGTPSFAMTTIASTTRSANSSATTSATTSTITTSWSSSLRVPGTLLFGGLLVTLLM